MDKNIKNPGFNTLTDALTLTKKQTQLSINCVKIGIIQSFDPARQRADIQIAYKQVKDILEDGTRVYEDYPPIKECPVVVLFGGVDVLTMPINPGDSCLVFFNDSDIDQWSLNGNGQHATTSRMHDISDAFALVGIRPLTNSIGNYLANGIRLSHAQGNSQLDFTDNLMESIAQLFLHNGNLQVTGDTLLEGKANIKGETLIESKTTVDDDLHVAQTTYTNGLVIGDGDMGGSGGVIRIKAHIEHYGNYNMQPGYTLNAPEVKVGNGATGTFDHVTVVDGIVVGGS